MQRTRAWRRSQADQHGKANAVQPRTPKPEKNWKLMYIRSAKLARARQLGLIYPIRSTRQLLELE